MCYNGIAAGRCVRICFNAQGHAAIVPPFPGRSCPINVPCWFDVVTFHSPPALVRREDGWSEVKQKSLRDLGSSDFCLERNSSSRLTRVDELEASVNSNLASIHLNLVEAAISLVPIAPKDVLRYTAFLRFTKRIVPMWLSW